MRTYIKRAAALQHAAVACEMLRNASSQPGAGVQTVDLTGSSWSNGVSYQSSYRASPMLCSSKPTVELENPTHAQVVVEQSDVRVLRRKCWQRFRENRGQKRVEPDTFDLSSDSPLAHAEEGLLPAYSGASTNENAQPRGVGR